MIVQLSNELMQTMPGGTLVEYESSCGTRREWARAKIQTAWFDPNGFGGRGAVSVRGDANCFYEGSMEIVEDVSCENGIHRFFVPSMDVHYAFAPAGIEIPMP